MKINREWYLDKLWACWKGKSIGGTMGAPYEASIEMQDISGFNSPKGQPIPNDDLDLQLIWLCAVEERGIQNITPETLGEYWISYIPPHWNEYGICKANMKLGVRPPFSGEYNNEIWKKSNGAWIRTEIWACLFPGFPQLAVKYAYNDACVDHGVTDGTYAAMFVAAMESSAFLEKDVQKLIETGLSYIPENCRVAQSVRLAQKCYKDGVPFREARAAIVEDSKDLGWFQAPANVAFVILGLLYGEGDYKKSMIYAIDCGDDTDCTGATIGSLMGIMYGGSYVPEDWAEYVGDEILSVAIDLSYLSRPTSCTELTRRIYELVPSAMKAYGMYTEYTDGPNEWEEVPQPFRFYEPFTPAEEGYKPPLKGIRNAEYDVPSTGLSLNFPDVVYAKVRVEFDKYKIKAGDTITLTFVGKNTMPAPCEVYIHLNLPEGWTADREEFPLYLHEMRMRLHTTTTVRVTAAENVKAVNTITATLTSPGRIHSAILPVILCG